MTARPQRPAAEADVEVNATVVAAELTFHDGPRTRVESFAEPDGESGSGSDRYNLPDRVEPGVTYRDVRVDYRLASKLIVPDRADDLHRGVHRD